VAELEAKTAISQHDLLLIEVEKLRNSKSNMEADVQQAWSTANEAVGQARSEIEKLGQEKDQEIAIMQGSCREQIMKLGEECEAAMRDLAERKGSEMATLEESCRLKTERVQQELQIVVEHAQRKVALLEGECREHVHQETKIFQSKLKLVTEERDHMQKELATAERSKSQVELEADERHHNAQAMATAKYAKLHRKLEAFRGSAGEQAEAQVAAFRQQHKALRAFTVAKLREGMTALEYVRSLMLKECEKLQLEVNGMAITDKALRLRMREIVELIRGECPSLNPECEAHLVSKDKQMVEKGMSFLLEGLRAEIVKAGASRIMDERHLELQKRLELGGQAPSVGDRLFSHMVAGELSLPGISQAALPPSSVSTMEQNSLQTSLGGSSFSIPPIEKADSPAFKSFGDTSKLLLERSKILQSNTAQVSNANNLTQISPLPWKPQIPSPTDKAASPPAVPRSRSPLSQRLAASEQLLASLRAPAPPFSSPLPERLAEAVAPPEPQAPQVAYIPPPITVEIPKAPQPLESPKPKKKSVSRSPAPSIDSLVSGMREHLSQVRSEMVSTSSPVSFTPSKSQIGSSFLGKSSPAPGGTLPLSFESFDTNGDGFIDRTEFLKGLDNAAGFTSPAKSGLGSSKVDMGTKSPQSSTPGDGAQGFEFKLETLGNDLRSSLRQRLNSL